MLLTELIVAIGMRWLRQQRGSKEGGWTPGAIWQAMNKLSLPGMNCQPFATATSRDKISAEVNVSMEEVRGFLCLSNRESALLMTTNFGLALILTTIGSLLVLVMQEEAEYLGFR